MASCPSWAEIASAGTYSHSFCINRSPPSLQDHCELRNIDLRVTGNSRNVEDELDLLICRIVSLPMVAKYAALPLSRCPEQLTQNGLSEAHIQLTEPALPPTVAHYTQEVTPRLLQLWLTELYATRPSSGPRTPTNEACCLLHCHLPCCHHWKPRSASWG